MVLGIKLNNVDGTGRDTYIANNNGGFTMMHQVKTQLHPGTIYYP